MENSSKTHYTSEDLDAMPASKLNALILSNPTMRCAVCKHFLKPPIMFVSRAIGNVCGNCNTFNESNAYHNTALETLFEVLVIPCCNFDKGCAIKLNYIDILAHETICPLRDFGCPLKPYENCPWKGSKLSLLKHILSHSLFSAQTTDNTFAFNLPDDESTDFIRFFNFANEDKFIFRALIDSDKMYFKIYYIGTREEPETFCYNILQSNCEGITEFVHGTYNIQNHFDEKFFQEIELNQMHFVNLKLCRLLAAKEKIAFKIQITIKNISNEKLDKKSLMYALECPVCKFMMRPPIFQCDGGHSICNKCKLKVKNCPVCRTHTFSGNIRNYSLESFASKLYFPCYSRDFGCNVNLLLSDIDAHESKCTYKLYKCEFCPWECRESSLMAHLKNVHEEKILFESCLILPKSFIESNPIFFIFAFNAIFKIQVTKDTGYYFDWTIELLGTLSADATYEYEIGGITKENISNKFVHSNITSKTNNIYDKYFFKIQRYPKA